MHLRILLVVEENDDVPLRCLVRCHPRHSITILGRVDHHNAVACIQQFSPDVVLVDADVDRVELLARWSSTVSKHIALICLSTDVLHAITAFNAGAVHYLRHPVCAGEMENALSRSAVKLAAFYAEQLGNPDSTHPHYIHTRNPPFRCNIIALPNSSGIEVRSSDELVSAHGEGNYTRVQLRKEPPVLLSRTLGDLEPHLEDCGLVRVHRSHMVNVELIRTVKRGKQPVLQLVTGAEVEVGERYRESLYELLHVGRFRRR